MWCSAQGCRLLTLMHTMCMSVYKLFWQTVVTMNIERLSKRLIEPYYFDVDAKCGDDNMQQFFMLYKSLDLCSQRKVHSWHQAGYAWMCALIRDYNQGDTWYPLVASSPLEVLWPLQPRLDLSLLLAKLYFHARYLACMQTFCAGHKSVCVCVCVYA